MLVSVVIPCYNVADCLPRTLEAALAQTYPLLEIICVDNNSTDETMAILQNYQARHPAKIQVLQEVKQGAPAARNCGLKAAKGDWIQFLDADDVLLPTKIERQVNLIKKETVLIAGNYFFENESATHFTQKLKPISVWLALFTGHLGITSSLLWRTKNVQNVGAWEENLKSSQEYELLFRVLQQSQKLVFDQKALTIIGLRANSISRGEGLRNNYYRMFNVHLEQLVFIKKHFPVDFKTHQNSYEAFGIKYLRDACRFHPQKRAILKDQFQKAHSLPSKIRCTAIGRVYTFLYNWLGFDLALPIFSFYKKMQSRFQ